MTAKAKWMMCLLCVIILLAAGCSDSIPALDKKSSPASGVTGTVPAKPGTPGQESMRLTVYHATKDAMYLVPEIHVVDKNDNPARTALALLAADPADKELLRIMPANAQLLNLKIQSGVAYADFSRGLAKKGGGSSAEMLLVAAIVNTLTEFPEIKSVQILVEGKKVDTLSGHVDISEPLSRSESIIKRTR